MILVGGSEVYYVRQNRGGELFGDMDHSKEDIIKNFWHDMDWRLQLVCGQMWVKLMIRLKKKHIL